MEMEMQRPVSSRINVGRVERGLSLATGLAMLAYTMVRRPKTEVGVDVVETLKQMTGGMGPDVCIDAVGMEAHKTGLEGRL